MSNSVLLLFETLAVEGFIDLLCLCFTLFMNALEHL